MRFRIAKRIQSNPIDLGVIAPHMDPDEIPMYVFEFVLNHRYQPINGDWF